jgi:hypothetical protein
LSFDGSYRDGGQTHLLAELADIQDCLDLGWTAGDPGLFGALALARLLPSVKHRREIRAVAIEALQGAANNRRYSAALLLRNWRVNRGALVLAREPRFRGNDGLCAEALYPASWGCDPVKLTYFRRFLRLAAAHKVTVFWLLPPLSPEVHAKRERTGIEPRYTEFARAAQERFANLIVVDGRHSGYDHTVHADPIHLDRRGALAFSAGVADVVGRSLTAPSPGPHWVVLPAFRDPLVRVGLEDIDESRVALRSRP